MLRQADDLKRSPRHHSASHPVTDPVGNSSRKMVLRTTFHNTVTTPIPADVKAEELIRLLHNHSFLITMSPVVTRHSVREEDNHDSNNHTTTGKKVSYDVWENLNFLPFGLSAYELQFMAAFTDKADGVISYLEAPMGFVSEANYTVKKGASVEGNGDGCVLEEVIESACSVLFRPFVEATMIPVRKKMHQRLIEEARSGKGVNG